jgi:hypothetical protein
MNVRLLWIVVFLGSALVFAHPASSADLAARWTKFAQALEALHQKRISLLDYVTEEKVGGYGGIRANPEFYREVRYNDRKSGRLLAIVQREIQPPNLLHTIELYIYDEQGRVLREYLATYLPHRRETPYQTLVTRYAYEGNLQAFRQFDASDDFLFEYCAGELDGKKVRIAWDDLDMPDNVNEITDDLTRKAYQVCFQSLPKTAGAYLDPMTELDSAATE